MRKRFAIAKHTQSTNSSQFFILVQVKMHVQYGLPMFNTCYSTEITWHLRSVDENNDDGQQYNNHAFKQLMMHFCCWLMQSVWLWCECSLPPTHSHSALCKCMHKQRGCRRGKLFSIHSRWWKSYSRPYNIPIHSTQLNPSVYACSFSTSHLLSVNCRCIRNSTHYKFCAYYSLLRRSLLLKTICWNMTNLLCIDAYERIRLTYFKPIEIHVNIECNDIRTLIAHVGYTGQWTWTWPWFLFHFLFWKSEWRLEPLTLNNFKRWILINAPEYFDSLHYGQGRRLESH